MSSSPGYRLLQPEYRGPGWSPPVKGDRPVQWGQFQAAVPHRPHTHTLTACLAWMLADPSARMVLKMGFRVLNTSSLSMPEPSWMHRRQARDAAARCSSPLPAERGVLQLAVSSRPSPPFSSGGELPIRISWDLS